MNAASGRLRPQGSLELGEYPTDLAWSPDGRSLLVGLADGSLLWVRLHEPATPRRVPGHDGGVLAVVWQKAGRNAVSAGQDGTVLLWDTVECTARPLLKDRQWSEQLAFNDDGRWLAVATGRSLRLFDAQGEERYQHTATGGAITALAWRPRLRELAAAGNGGVTIHRPPPEADLRDYPLRGACLSAAFSPDGRRLAAGMQEGAVQLWNLATDTSSQMGGYGARVLATEWSANGRYLATAAGNTLAIWDCSGRGPEGSRPLAYEAHAERITAIAFRPTGVWLASTARDRRLLWWRVGAGDAPQDAHLLRDECSVLRFSRDGARLAVADAGGKLTLFDCQP